MRNMRAWLMWGLLLPAYFISFFHRTSLSTLSDPLAQAWDLRADVGAALGTLAGIYFVVYAVLQIPSGVVADTVGARVTVSVSSAVM
ncbi:MAG: MFS transporter, partial [Chitinivibrionales bacterium]|nr:MFS transporter [Chitinivibrionales bacterium]